jgi:hypothetical protein
MFQDETLHYEEGQKLSICGRNIDLDPTGETGIEFLPLSPKVWDFPEMDHKI